MVENDKQDAVSLGDGLALDEILQVLDQAHLLILDNAVDLGLFSHVPESEDLVRDGIIIVLLTDHLIDCLNDYLLQELLLHQ